MAQNPVERASPGKRGSPPCRLPPILPAASGDAQEAGGAAAGMLWDVGQCGLGAQIGSSMDVQAWDSMGYGRLWNHNGGSTDIRTARAGG